MATFWLEEPLIRVQCIAGGQRDVRSFGGGMTYDPQIWWEERLPRGSYRGQSL